MLGRGAAWRETETSQTSLRATGNIRSDALRILDKKIALFRRRRRDEVRRYPCEWQMNSWRKYREGVCLREPDGGLGPAARPFGRLVQKGRAKFVQQKNTLCHTLGMYVFRTSHVAWSARHFPKWERIVVASPAFIPFAAPATLSLSVRNGSPPWMARKNEFVCTVYHRTCV